MTNPQLQTQNTPKTEDTIKRDITQSHITVNTQIS